MRNFLGLLAGILTINTLSAQDLHSAIDPQPRGDQGWKDRQASFNKRVEEVGEKAEVIFIGDSITQGWEGDGKEAWAKHFAKYNGINLGIGGDRTQHVLWRLNNGNLKGLKPKAAVVMIGTNNSNGEDNTVEQIAEGVAAIVHKLRESLPNTKVILIPIFPRSENPSPQRGKILQVNQIIQKLADNKNVIWADFGHKFIDQRGRIPRDLMPDYLHLTPKAYTIWAESISDVLAAAVGGQASAIASDADVSGDWVGTMPGPDNQPIDMPFSLKKDGGKLSGTFARPDGGTLPIENGKVEGNSLSWTVKRNRPNGESMTYRMKAIVEGRTIRGTATTDLDGNPVTIDWTGKKK